VCRGEIPDKSSGYWKENPSRHIGQELHKVYHGKSQGEIPMGSGPSIRMDAWQPRGFIGDSGIGTLKCPIHLTSKTSKLRYAISRFDRSH
jgi:hypothetical protein